MGTIEESPVVDLALHHQFGPRGTGTNLGDLVDDPAPVDGVERDEVGVLDGLVSNIVVIVQLEDVAEIEEVPFPVPFGVFSMLLVGDGAIVRGDSQLYVPLNHLRVPHFVEGYVGQSPHGHLRA